MPQLPLGGDDQVLVKRIERIAKSVLLIPRGWQSAVPITPADRTGTRVDYFPVHAPSPRFSRVGIRVMDFEACSAGPPETAFCHEASARPVARPSRSLATRSIDNSLGGTLPRW